MTFDLSSRLNPEKTSASGRPKLNPKTASMLRRLCANDIDRLIALCSSMNAMELSKLPDDILETVRNFNGKAVYHA